MQTSFLLWFDTSKYKFNIHFDIISSQLPKEVTVWLLNTIDASTMIADSFIASLNLISLPLVE